jgi:hypothetical protein
LGDTLTPFSFKVQGQTLFVTGYLDERSDFSKISGPFDTVNLQSVVGFSSIGLRQFLQFLYAQVTPSIALAECPVSFIETIDAVSGLLKGTKLKIESLMVPFKCDDCMIEVELPTKCADVALKGAAIELPTHRCHKCRQPLRLHVDPHEYFLFLYN